MEANPDAYLKEIAETAEKTWYHAKKKNTFYKEQAPKQVEAYLEKIKDIPKKSSCISMKPAFRRRCTDTM